MATRAEHLRQKLSCGESRVFTPLVWRLPIIVGLHRGLLTWLTWLLLPPRQALAQAGVRFYTSSTYTSSTYICDTHHLHFETPLPCHTRLLVGGMLECMSGWVQPRRTEFSFVVCERDLKEITSAPRLQSPARFDLVTKPML